jgi:toxin ParE1/3/4
VKHTLTPAAERDIRDILRQTLKRFGTRQLLAYQQIIVSGIEMVADIPDRPGSLDRSDILPGLRLWHLEQAAGRRGGAAHCLYYRLDGLPDRSTGVTIVRVLHEHMEPRHRILRSLRKP